MASHQDGRNDGQLAALGIEVTAQPGSLGQRADEHDDGEQAEGEQAALDVGEQRAPENRRDFERRMRGERCGDEHGRHVENGGMRFEGIAHRQREGDACNEGYEQFHGPSFR